MISIAPRRSSPAALAATAAASILVLLAALPAVAHADLKTATPADGATLETPPSGITLTFTEGLSAAKASFKVVDAAGSTVITAKPAKNGATSMTADGSALAPGAYTIKWTAAAEDGHTTRGQLHFTITAPTPAPATPSPSASDTPSEAPANPSPSAAPATAVPTPTAMTAATTPAPAPSADTSSSTSATGSGDVLLPILGAIIVLGVIGVLVLRRSKAA